jgi:hypothetical protein
MTHKRNKSILCILLIMLVFSAGVQAQNEENSTVAILVVDFFERSQEELEELEQVEADPDSGPQNCAVTIDGQDDTRWDGGSSGLDVYPINMEHGAMVSTELAYSLIERGWVYQRSIAQHVYGAPNWIKYATLWERDNGGGGRIIVIGVNAGNTTQTISERIEQTINSLALFDNEEEDQQEDWFHLAGEFGAITRIVVNMSFGLIPCKEMLEAEYKSLIEMDGALEEFKQYWESNLEGDLHCENNAKLEEALSLFISGMSDNNLPLPARHPLNQHLASVFEEYYPEQIGGVYEGCQGFGTVLGNSSGSNRCTGKALGANNNYDYYLGYDPLAELFEKYVPSPCNDGSWTDTPDGEPIYVIPVASAGNENLPYPYAPAYWPTVLSVSADYNLYGNSDDNSERIICAPSNEEDAIEIFLGNVIDEARNKWEDNGWPEWGDNGWPEWGEDTANRIRMPEANAGEVVEDGIASLCLLNRLGIVISEEQLEEYVQALERELAQEFGEELAEDFASRFRTVCLFEPDIDEEDMIHLEYFPLGCPVGTSFAAPRVSVRQAEYLVRGYTTTECIGVRGDSKPPLAHVDSPTNVPWDNLSIPEAQTCYCGDFRLTPGDPCLP